MELLAAENQSLREQNALLVDKLEALSLELARLRRQLFGARSERRPGVGEAQVGLFEAPEPTAPEPAPAPARPAVATPHGRRPPAGTPDEVIVSPAPNACPACGGVLREVSRSTATRLDWRRGHFVRVRVERPSCACDRCRTVETAPEPSTFALPRSIIGNGLAAQVVIDKFADNIPLNRQSTRFEREGLDLSLSTLCDTVRGIAGLLSRVVLAMKAEQLAGHALRADDTGLPVLDGETGKAVAGRLWVYLDDRNVVYDFTPTKQGKGPAAYLAGFKGVLLADGGSEFNEAVRALGLTRAGCWSHARRYFIDAEETSPALAAEGIGIANRLFAIERGLDGADAATRALVRGTQTRQVLDEMHAWLTAKVHGLRPKSAIGKAFHYVLGQWDPLVVCADHPEIPIHNNLSELQLRRPVIGRKNWLFAGSEGGAKAAAVLFSITGSCRLHGIDPYEYLVDVLERINDHPVNRVAELTPANWAQR